MSVNSVNNFISKYNRYGAKVLEDNRAKHRKRFYMTFEEEKIFLEQFLEESNKGMISTVKKIKLAYEKKIGKNVHKTTIYRLLKRHNWRKVVPRPIHPKSNKEEQEEFKKKVSKRVLMRH